MRYSDSSNVEQHHGKIIMRKDGIMFVEHWRLTNVRTKPR
jgi:hypothetical protein